MSKQENARTQTSEAERLLAQYRTRLATEGWIKAALCGLTVGFAMHFLYTFVCLVFGIKMFWVGALLFALGAATTPLFYFTRFKKSIRQVASRVDTLGLEERVLTMAQLEGDDSFMARRQREDTIHALKTVNASLIKLAVSVPLIVLCATTCVLSATAVTANAVVDESLIQYFSGVKNDEAASYTVSYKVKDDTGGVIAGTLDQTIKTGQTGSPVQAIANDGYVFVGWTDGFEPAFRADADVHEDFIVYAVFMPIDEQDLPDPDDSDDPQPGEPGESQAKPSDSDKKPSDNPGDPSEDGGTGEGGGAGGSSAPSNQVIDGQTYYGNEYGNSLSDAQDAMNGNTDMSKGQTDAIGDYFGNIAK